MLRLITSILGTVSVIGGLIFLVLPGLTVATIVTTSEALAKSFYMNEAQVYGIGAIACFCFSLVINLADISSQLDKVLDGLATLVNDDEETDATA